MKKIMSLTLGLILCMFVLSSVSFAADKIGFINLKEIMQTSNAGKKAAEEFKKLVEKKQQGINALETEIKKMKDELDKQGAMMTPSARGDKETAYQKKLRDYQLLVDDTNKELQKRDQEYSQKLIPEILKSVRTIAEREKYSLVLDISTMPMPYYDKSQDISKKVIEEFNKAQDAKK